MKSIQFAGLIDKVTKKKDGTLSVQIGTQEMPPEDTAHIFYLFQKEIWIALSEVALAEEDLSIPESIKEFGNEKSPSERLRNVLWVYWDTKTDKKEDFNSWRNKYMEKLITNIKDKIN